MRKRPIGGTTSNERDKIIKEEARLRVIARDRQRRARLPDTEGAEEMRFASDLGPLSAASVAQVYRKPEPGAE